MWVVLVLLLGGGAVVWARFGSSDEGVDAATLGQEVQLGPLRISVVERGNLKAAKSIDIKSEVEGRTTILWLISEGSVVEEGDPLCELDTSQAVEQRVSQQISVQNAEASHVKAVQNYEIQLSENASNTERAERELEFARMDLQKYREGDGPQERQRCTEEIVLAEEELTRATQEYEWSEKLADRGYLEKTQLDADRLAKNRAEIQLAQKRRALELYEEYEYPRTESELVADVTEKERELERARLQAEARIADFDAEKSTSEARLDLEREKLAKLDSQIAKAHIVAPAAGMVVYSQVEDSRDQPIQEGTQVFERQVILTIPSSRGMIAEVRLHESVLDKVEVGMPCIVTVDALPDRTFAGRLRFKSVLPDTQSRWTNPDLRVYRSEVELLEDDPRARPGMSCSIEVIVDELEDVLHVPVQSIFLDGGSTVAFVARGGSVEKRSVEVGENNGKWVVVKSGLELGETVLLSPPPGSILAPAPRTNEEPEGLPEFDRSAQEARARPPSAPDDAFGASGWGAGPAGPAGPDGARGVGGAGGAGGAGPRPGGDAGAGGAGREGREGREGRTGGERPRGEGRPASDTPGGGRGGGSEGSRSEGAGGGRSGG